MLTTVHTPRTPWLESALQMGRGSRPNGVDSRRWPLGPGGAGLVWFGRFTPEKAPHLAVEPALRAHRPLVLAGTLSDSVYFAERIAPRLSDEVRYAGYLDQNALDRLVGGSAAALVTPTWDEPYGLVIAEACPAAPRWWRLPAAAFRKSLHHKGADWCRPAMSMRWPRPSQPQWRFHG